MDRTLCERVRWITWWLERKERRNQRRTLPDARWRNDFPEVFAAASGMASRAEVTPGRSARARSSKTQTDGERVALLTTNRQRAAEASWRGWWRGSGGRGAPAPGRYQPHTSRPDGSFERLPFPFASPGNQPPPRRVAADRVPAPTCLPAQVAIFLPHSSFYI